MGFGTRVGIVGRVGTRVTTRLDLPVVGREPESGYANYSRPPSTSNRHIGLFGPHVIVTTGHWHGDHGVFSHRDYGAAASGNTYGTTDSEDRGKPGGTSSSTSALPEETRGTF